MSTADVTGIAASVTAIAASVTAIAAIRLLLPAADTVTILHYASL